MRKEYSENSNQDSELNSLQISRNIKSLPLGIIYRKNCEGSLKNVLDVLSLIDGHFLLNADLDVDEIYSSSKNLAISIASDGSLSTTNVTLTNITATSGEIIHLKGSDGVDSLTVDTSKLVKMTYVSPLGAAGGDEFTLSNTYGGACLKTAGDSDGEVVIFHLDTPKITAYNTSGVLIESNDESAFLKMKDGYFPVIMGDYITPIVNSSFPGMQIGNKVNMLSDEGATGDLHIGINMYYDGTNWRYMTDGAASIFAVREDSLEFYTAGSGTAGDIVSYSLVWSAP